MVEHAMEVTVKSLIKVYESQDSSELLLPTILFGEIIES